MSNLPDGMNLADVGGPYEPPLSPQEAQRRQTMAAGQRWAAQANRVADLLDRFPHEWPPSAETERYFAIMARQFEGIAAGLESTFFMRDRPLGQRDMFKPVLPAAVGIA